MFFLNQQVMRRWVDPVDPDTVLITGAHGQGTHGIRAPCVVRYSSSTTYRDMIVVGWRATRDGPRPVHADPHALDRGASEVAAGLAEVIGYWRPDPSDTAAVAEGKRLVRLLGNYSDEDASASSAGERAGRAAARKGAGPARRAREQKVCSYNEVICITIYDDKLLKN